MSSPIFHTSKTSDIYIVRVDPNNSRHHGLRSNSSQYVLTFRPNPGDKIEFVLPGRQETWWRVTGMRSGRMIAWMYSLRLISEDQRSRYQNKKKILISSCPGYGSSLGEDTWEDGVDQPILKDLIRGAIGPFSDCDWLYAPVSIQELNPTDPSLPDYLYYRITSEEGCVLISEAQHRRGDEFAKEKVAKLDFEEKSDEQHFAVALEEVDDSEEEMNWEED